MTKGPRRTLIAVGVVSLLMAAGGAWYNVQYLTSDYSGVLEELGEDPAKFYPVFYTMSGICILFYLLLAITGIQLMRLREQWSFVLVAIVVAEVAYWFSIMPLSTIPEYGDSIPSALGVSSGGLLFQVFILFPIWAPLAALWARKRILGEERRNDL